MATKTEIANLALMRLEDTSDLADLDADKATDPRAAALAAAWDIAFDATLRTHPWNFARRLFTLGAAATPPAFGFARAFPLPVNPWTVRVWRLDPDRHGDHPRWRVVGRELHTDEGAPLHAELIVRADITDADPLFALAMATKLAALTAARITGDRKLGGKLDELWRREWHTAKAHDAQEHGHVDPQEGRLMRARRGGA